MRARDKHRYGHFSGNFVVRGSILNIVILINILGKIKTFVLE